MSVDDEKLPNVTPDSQIQVGVSHSYNKHPALFTCCSGETEFVTRLHSGFALSPAHVRHDRERAREDRGTHRSDRRALV